MVVIRNYGTQQPVENQQERQRRLEGYERYRVELEAETNPEKRAFIQFAMRRLCGDLRPVRT
jgi:hypothetical protein